MVAPGPPAVPKVNMEIKIKIIYEFGPASAPNRRCSLENDSPDPPPDPPGEGDKNKLKSVLEYSWAGLIWEAFGGIPGVPFLNLPFLKH